MLAQSGSNVLSNTYTVSNTGALKNVSSVGGASTDTAAYAYDANWNNTLETISGDIVHTKTYNKLNQVKSVVNTVDGSTASSFTYDYLLNGNVSSETGTNGTKTYAYDGLGRLKQENANNYYYDDYSNRSGNNKGGVDYNYQYDKNNRLLKMWDDMSDGGGSIPPKTTLDYTYDNNGNQTTRLSSVEVDLTTNEPGSPASDYIDSLGADVVTEFDGFNRLKKAFSGSGSIEYTYNGDGLMVKKVEKDSTSAVVKTTEFVYDGANIIAEFVTSDESYSNLYKRGLNLFAGVLCHASGGGVKVNYNYNGHGDVVQVTDGIVPKQILRGLHAGDLNYDFDNDGLVDVMDAIWYLQNSAYISYNYDAFGNRTVTKHAMAVEMSPFGYCGEYYDSSTSYIYLRARWYDSATGRFISEDPIRDGLNWYAYCGGNPVNFVDPLGLDPVSSPTDKGPFWKPGDTPNLEFGDPARGSISDEYRLSLENYISGCTTTDPVTVIENGNYVIIYAYVNIANGIADLNVPKSKSWVAKSGLTYRQAIVAGIKENWSGQYGDKTVGVYIIDLNDGQTHYTKEGQESVSITVKSGSGLAGVQNYGRPWKRSTVGDMTLYTSYTFDEVRLLGEIKYVAAHEFGHILGVGDARDADDIAPNNDLMRVAGGITSALDIELMLKAQKTNQYQSWPKTWMSAI